MAVFALFRDKFKDLIDFEEPEAVARADHVAHCGCFLAFMSEDYLASENCKDELNYARDLNLPRLLIYLEDVMLTGGLAMRHNRLQALHYYKYLEMKGMFYKRLYQSSVLSGADVKDC